LLFFQEYGKTFGIIHFPFCCYLSPNFSAEVEGIHLIGMLKASNKGGELPCENFLILRGSGECM